MAQCPCGSAADLDDCCGPIISGSKAAPTAEALMRSRYTAFVQGNLYHIENTYARDMRDLLGPPGAGDMLGSVDWMGLEIIDTRRGGVFDDAGTVEFVARFRKDGKISVHRERSSFRREDGYWVYVDGVTPDIPAAGKTGRNDPCPCGSGKKYKKCCAA